MRNLKNNNTDKRKRQQNRTVMLPDPITGQAAQLGPQAWPPPVQQHSGCPTLSIFVRDPLQMPSTTLAKHNPIPLSVRTQKKNV